MEKHEIKKASKSTALRDEIERRAAKAAYLARKTKVLDGDEDNFVSVIALRTNGKWWCIVGRSVLYYSQIIVPRIREKRKKEVNIRPDTDYGVTSKEGIIYIPDIDRFIKEVESVGYKAKKTGNDYVGVRLNKVVTAEELNYMRKSAEEKWEQAEKIISPAVVWPAAKVEAMELLVLVRAVVKDMDKVMQQTLGARILTENLDIVRLIEVAARGDIGKVDALLEIKKIINQLDADVLSVMYLRLTTEKRAVMLSGHLLALSRATEKELKKEIRKVSRNINEVQDEQASNK